MLNNNELIAGTCLLLSIVKSDEIIHPKEIKAIKEIITDFFDLDNQFSDKIIHKCINKLDESTDLYEFSKELNKTFSYQDKIDFISCAFEVAYSDGTLHYLEEHFIKKISNSLNVQLKDLIESKVEMKKYIK